MPNDEKQNKTRAQDKRRWELPLDFVALSHEEFVAQQEYIRDRAHEILIEIISAKNPKPRGILAWQELALRAESAIQKSYEAQSVRDKEPIQIVYEYNPVE